MNTSILHRNTTLPCSITNNLGNKICIPGEDIIGKSEEINSDYYNTNKININFNVITSSEGINYMRKILLNNAKIQTQTRQNWKQCLSATSWKMSW